MLCYHRHHIIVISIVIDIIAHVNNFAVIIIATDIVVVIIVVIAVIIVIAVITVIAIIIAIVSFINPDLAVDFV